MKHILSLDGGGARGVMQMKALVLLEAQTGKQIYELFDAVDRSSAAPLYFGPVVDDHEHRVWLDGGVGMFNNPALYAYVDASRLDWLKEGVRCFSVGNGFITHWRSFSDAADDGKIAQVLNFLAPKDGGMARRNAPQVVSDFLNNIQTAPQWEFHRIDLEIDWKLNRMDGIKFMSEYEEIGVQLGGMLCEVWEVDECVSDSGEV